MTKHKESSSHFQALSKKERTQIDQRGKEVYKYSSERLKWESHESSEPAKRASKATETDKIRVPKSPIASKPSHLVDKKKVPPNRYQTPKPNPTVEPLQKRSHSYSESNKVGKSHDKGRNQHSDGKQPNNRGQSSHKNK